MHEFSQKIIKWTLNLASHAADLWEEDGTSYLNDFNIACKSWVELNCYKIRCCHRNNAE